MRDGYLRSTLPRTPTARQIDVLAAFVATGGSVSNAAARVGVRPSTAKRHLADLRARSGLTTEQLIFGDGRRGGWWWQVLSPLATRKRARDSSQRLPRSRLRAEWRRRRSSPARSSL